MKQQGESNVERAANEAMDRLRSKHAIKHLEDAKDSLRPSSATAFLVRVALGLVYMYLIVVSYMMMDAMGPVIVSVLFLAAILVPHFYRFVAGRSTERLSPTNGTKVVEEAS